MAENRRLDPNDCIREEGFVLIMLGRHAVHKPAPESVYLCQMIEVVQTTIVVIHNRDVDRKVKKYDEKKDDGKDNQGCRWNRLSASGGYYVGGHISILA